MPSLRELARKEGGHKKRKPAQPRLFLSLGTLPIASGPCRRSRDNPPLSKIPFRELARMEGEGIKKGSRRSRGFFWSLGTMPIASGPCRRSRDNPPMIDSFRNLVT